MNEVRRNIAIIRIIKNKEDMQFWSNKYDFRTQEEAETEANKKDTKNQRKTKILDEIKERNTR